VRWQGERLSLVAGSAGAIEGITGMWQTASGRLEQTAFSSCSAIPVLVDFILRTIEQR
jgi:hypothetical protein